MNVAISVITRHTLCEMLWQDCSVCVCVCVKETLGATAATGAVQSRKMCPVLPQRRGSVRCSLCMRHCPLACSIGLAAKGDIWWLMCSHVPPLLWAADALHRQIAGRGMGVGWKDGQSVFICAWGPGVNFYILCLLYYSGKCSTWHQIC